MTVTAAPAPATELASGVRVLLARARRDWRRAALLRGAALGVVALLAGAAVLVAVDQLASLPAAARALLRWLPPLAALAALVPVVRRVVPGPDARRLALLLEESNPDLAHTLTTALDAGGDGPVARAFARQAAARLRAQSASTNVPARLRGPARTVLAAAAAALLVMLLVPGGAGTIADRWLRPADAPASGLVLPGGAAVGGTAAARANGHFGPLRVTVEPPAYTGLPSRTLRPAEPVAALAGSRLRIEGRVPDGAARIAANGLGSASPGLARSGDTWHVEWTLGAADRGVALEAATADGTAIARHVLPVTVLADREPDVELLLPDDDLVLASADGVLEIRAIARDDHGIAAFGLAWILSSGSGESFSFTDGAAAFDSVHRAGHTWTGSHRLDLRATGMRPGDVLHLRAVARDANAVTGPGEGVSRTRVVRIARDDEFEQVTTLLAFPMEVEHEPILSQRMIVLLIERLLERAAALAPAVLRGESEQIAFEQMRLRERVADIIYARTSGADDGHDHGPVETPRPRTAAADADSLDFLAWSRRMQELLEAASRATGTGTLEELSHNHDPDPALAVNLNLVPAFNAMYEAERLLRQAEPAAALPHARRALDIIQRIREAERVFVRGRQTVAPVDVAAARGTGRLDDAAPGTRTTGRALPAADAHVADIAALAGRLDNMPPRDASLALAALAARVLEDAALDARAGALLGRAAEAAANSRAREAAALAAEARSLLLPARGSGPPAPALPIDAAGAAYLARIAGNGGGAARTASVSRDAGAPAAAPPRAAVTRPTAPARPFVFATIRYASGNWDSAQLVPANIVHSLAQYTDIAVAAEGEFVDLDSPDVFRYPFLFMTGHLPVRFTAAEARNLRDYVDRGGFVFIDDHNHDIDGAFHRTVTAELARIFGPDALERLPNDHELYHSFFVFENGPPTTSHELNGWGDGLVHEHLYAVLRNGRIGVLYSNKDYASEWSYHVQNKRFLSLDNTRFGVNIVVYALTR